MNGLWNNVAKYAHDLGVRIWADDFSRGVVCGLAAYFAALILVHLLFLICGGRKKCSQLVVCGEKGEIAVSIKAVASLVRAALERCAQLDVSRIYVYRHKKAYVFDVRGSFRVGASGAPEIYGTVAEQIKAEMKNVFGIENIEKVDLHIESCDTEAGVSAPAPAPAEKPTVESVDADK